MSQSRRLAAIFAADVVGYSRLMGADEEGTLQRAQRHPAFPGAWWGVLKIRAIYEATYFAGLRKAGMPEE
jgi:hypothetical protein